MPVSERSLLTALPCFNFHDLCFTVESASASCFLHSFYIMLLESFPPCFSTDARLLVLGSMPGRASLDAHRYYAHPRNAFWPILGDVFGGLPVDYPARLQWAKSHKVALWDVLKHCERKGSLDTSIKVASEIPNAIGELLHQAPQLKRIVFNGQKAKQAFQRHCKELLSVEGIEFKAMPSTSPAHASLSYSDKLLEWRAALAL